MSGITQEAIAELGSRFEQFKGYNEKSIETRVGKTEATLRDEIAKSSEATLAQYDRLVAQQKAEQQKLQETIDQLATAINRTGNAYIENSEAGQKAQNEIAAFSKSQDAAWAGKRRVQGAGEQIKSVEELNEYRKAFDSMLRYGKENLPHEVQKSLAVGIDPDGGAFLLPPDRSPDMVKRVFETTPLRKVARVINTSSHEYEILEDPNRMSTGGWVSEKKPRNATPTPTLAVKKIVPGEIYAEPPVTQIMLEDSAFDVQAYITEKADEAFALDENTAFVTGDGVGKPRGFLTYQAGSNSDGTNKWGEIEQIPSGTSGAFTYLQLVRATTAFRNEADYANLQWLFRRATVQYLMTLTNAAGQYIFQPIANGELNGTPLLGYPIMYANDMPAVAAGALAGAIANWKNAYYIVDRVGLSTLRDPYTAKPFTLFYMRKRVGADVVNYDSIKLLKLA